MTDPYAILGVTRDSSDEEITKAYRALARKYHPDLHPGDKIAEQKMKEINAAYEQIQAIRSGKASDTASGQRTYYRPASGYYGSAGQYRSGSNGQNPFGDDDIPPSGGYYGGRRPAAFNIFRIPFVRVIMVIVVIRFVISVIMMLFSGISGGYSYSPYSYGSYASSSYSQEISSAQNAEDI